MEPEQFIRKNIFNEYVRLGYSLIDAEAISDRTVANWRKSSLKGKGLSAIMVYAKSVAKEFRPMNGVLK